MLEHYREASREVPDALQRIGELAEDVYAAKSDVKDKALLLRLLDPLTVQVAQLAWLDSGSYHIERSRQSDRSGLYHRMGWFLENGNFLRTVLRTQMQADLDGFARSLADSMQPVAQSVTAAEKLRAHLEPPQTIAIEPPEWEVVRAK